MFWLYCLPGKLLMYWQWLFPGNYADVAGTQRRKDSKFIHFIFSTLIYFFAAWVLLQNNNDPQHRKERADRDPVPTDERLERSSDRSASKIFRYHPTESAGSEPLDRSQSVSDVSNDVVGETDTLAPMESVSAPVTESSNGTN
jgi:hypothetical protein